MRAREARKKVYYLNEINIYNFTPNPRLTKIFIAFFNYLGFSIFRISVVHLTHVRTGVCQAMPLIDVTFVVLLEKIAPF